MKEQEKAEAWKAEMELRIAICKMELEVDQEVCLWQLDLEAMITAQTALY